jgi:hypothetical protein
MSVSSVTSHSLNRITFKSMTKERVTVRHEFIKYCKNYEFYIKLTLSGSTVLSPT